MSFPNKDLQGFCVSTTHTPPASQNGREGQHARAMDSKSFFVNDQSPEFKFGFVFFRLQMLRFSALCGPNEQKFGELLT